MEIKNSILRLILVIAIFTVSSTSFADSEIIKLSGGALKLNVEFYSTALTGFGAQNSTFGNSASSLLLDATKVVTNPASIAYLSKKELLIDFVPEMSIDLANIGDLNKTINDELDKQDMLRDGYNPEDMNVKSELNQLGWINGASFIYPTPYGNIGLAYHKPFYLKMSGLLNNLVTTVRDSTSDTITDLDISMGAVLNLEVKFDEVDFVYAYKIFDNFSVGCGINYLKTDNNFVLDNKIDGMITRNEISTIFSDPNDPWQNSLNSRGEGNFNGHLYQFSLATNYKPLDWLNLDVTFKSPYSDKLKGNLNITQYKLGALDIGAEEDGVDGIPGTDDDEDILSAALMDAAQMTHSDKIVYNSDYLELSIPGKIGLTTSFKVNNWSFILGYEKSLGEFSYNYRCDIKRTLWQDVSADDEPASFEEVAESDTKDYTVGFKPNHTIKFAIGWKRIALSGSLITIKTIMTNMTDSDGVPIEEKDTFLGSLGTGFGFHITENTVFDMNLVVLPAPFLRTTLTYDF